MDVLGVLEHPRLNIPDVFKLGRKVSVLALLLWFVLLYLITNKINNNMKDDSHTPDSFHPAAQ